MSVTLSRSNSNASLLSKRKDSDSNNINSSKASSKRSKFSKNNNNNNNDSGGGVKKDGISRRAEFMEAVNYGRTIYSSLLPDSRSQAYFRNLVGSIEKKALDVQTSQPLYNNLYFNQPIPLSFVSPGVSNHQRVGNKIILHSLRCMVLLDKPNMFLSDGNSDLTMPNILFRWAILWVRGPNTLTPGNVFNFNNIFQDLDYQGNVITVQSLQPNPYLVNPVNAFSYVTAGNSFQGYRESYSVIKEGSNYMSGIPSSSPNSVNGNYVSTFHENADTRFSWNSPHLADFSIDLLDPNSLSTWNDGNYLSTSFQTDKPWSGNYTDITDGGLYFIYGTSYPTSILKNPLLTVHSRLNYIDKS